MTESYRNSFFADGRAAISTARAGNVVGGGDFAADRIIPDCIRAIENGSNVVLRNPQSIRPYQHVLEPVFAYLCIAARQYSDPSVAGAYNVGPQEDSCITTEKLVETFCEYWNRTGCGNLGYSCGESEGPHEAGYLRLDCSKIRERLGWRPKWTYREMLEKTAEWTRGYIRGEEAVEIMRRQIAEYVGNNNKF